MRRFAMFAAACATAAALATSSCGTTDVAIAPTDAGIGDSAIDATPANDAGVSSDAGADAIVDAIPPPAPYCVPLDGSLDSSIDGESDASFALMCPSQQGFVECGGSEKSCCADDGGAMTCTEGACGARACCVDDDCGYAGTCMIDPTSGVGRCKWSAYCNDGSIFEGNRFLYCPSGPDGLPARCGDAMVCMGATLATAKCVSAKGVKTGDHPLCCAEIECPMDNTGIICPTAPQGETPGRCQYGAGLMRDPGDRTR